MKRAALEIEEKLTMFTVREERCELKGEIERQKKKCEEGFEQLGFYYMVLLQAVYNRWIYSFF